MSSKTQAMESFKRNREILNKLIDTHDGDPNLISVDILMVFSLMINALQKDTLKKELCVFAIESIEYISEDL